MIKAILFTAILALATAKHVENNKYKTMCTDVGGHCIYMIIESCDNGVIDSAYLCNGMFKVCCIPSKPPPTDPPGPTNPPPTRPIVPQGQCGGIQSSARIVNGQEANANTWPWQVSLQYMYYGAWMHICGGTLVAPNVVVTAAHCVDMGTKADFKIVAGLHSQKQVGKAFSHDIDAIIMHEDYNGDGDGFPNDIAVIKLSTPVDPDSEKVGYACMPEPGHNFDDHTCYITGWGDTKGTGDQNLLQELKIEVIPQAQCTGIWGSRYINGGHICVGMGTKGACNGDSGGPLVCEVNGRWTLAGATSWGRAGCQTYGYPNVYSRTTFFLDWIEKNMH